MISIGIRFEKGFDKSNVLNLMESVPSQWDYDFLVLGSSPGGVACAREASSAGKRTAIVRWRKLSPAEEDGFDENLEEIAGILEREQFLPADSTEFFGSQAKLPKAGRSSVLSSLHSSKSVLSAERLVGKGKKKGAWWRKVRYSRMDLNNELYKRGKEGRKLMLRAAKKPNSIEEAVNFGWRIHAPIQSLTINWRKMSELVMDHIMRENWSLVNELADEGIEIIEGQPSFVDCHTVRISLADSKECEITADLICAAPSADHVIPLDVPGATQYGITCDDFVRLGEPPGKTLVVGSTPEGLECAGIVACLRMPVTVVSRSELLRGHDRGMARLVIDNLRSKGVAFAEKTSLASIKLTSKAKLLARLESVETTERGGVQEEKKQEGGGMPLKVREQEFDTVVFAVGKQTSLDHLNLEEIGIVPDFFERKICTNEEDLTSVPNIYAIGEGVAYRPQSIEVSEAAGKLLGRRLFWEGSDLMDYTMVPHVVITPTEYAFVGLSEDGALDRFGKECVEVYEGAFTPLESVSSHQENRCLVKAIVFKPKKMVIGLHMFGPEAGEVVQGFAAAIKLGMTIGNLLSLVGMPATKAQEMARMKERPIEGGNIA